MKSIEASGKKLTPVCCL